MPFSQNKSKLAGLFKGDPIFERIFLIGFFVAVCGYFLFYDNRVIMIGSVAVGVLSTLTFFFAKIRFSKVQMPLNTIWYLLFFALAELSTFWAVFPDVAARNGLVFMIMMLILGFGVAQYAVTSIEVEKILLLYIYAAFLISAVQLFFTPVNQWFAGYFGTTVGSNNSNNFGFLCLTAAILSFFFAYIRGRKKYYILVVFFLFMCLLTSSRKALIMSLAGVVLVTLFAFRKKGHLMHFGLICIVALFAFMLVMNVDFLYDVIGYRFEGFLEEFFNSDDLGVEGSLELRHTFIAYAKALFKEKPLLGQGFVNYASIIISKFLSRGSYAHNNYWEILADLGAVGFIVYYWFYVYLLIKSIVQIVKNPKNSLAVLGFILLICQIILEWGVVSILSFFPQISISLIYICITCSTSNRKYHYAPTLNKR